MRPVVGSGSMSPKQMGRGGMAAPGCVQSRSVGGPSSMGDGGDKEIQRRALRLYWPASKYAIVCVGDFIFIFFSACL